MTTTLVTGGAGYIGSHTCVQLLTAGHRVVVVDNLVNASAVAIERVRALVPAGDLVFHPIPVQDGAALGAVFASEVIDAVIHFAGHKAVGESVEQPLSYYDNNLGSTIALLHAMTEHGVRDLVFSSSATVYGGVERMPIVETDPTAATSPYGRTKLFIEEILRDVAASDPSWRIALLRYFNPVGADPRGTIGEDPDGVPNNLMPFVMQVAVGRREHLVVFGTDYDTPDGTAVRDYIHVVDLADAHLAALDAIAAGGLPGATAINIGTGTGSSVLDVVAAASRAVGHEIPHVFADRRVGDVAVNYADTTLAAQVLGWKARHDLDDMCRDHWNWQRTNPAGYGTD